MGDGVDDGVLHRRGGADRPGLADALGAERVHRCRCGHVDQLEARQLGRRDERVVGQRRGRRVAVLVVEDLLQQRLRHPLGEAAVPLALGEQRVEDRAGVVDGDQPHQLAPCRTRRRPRRRPRARRTGTSARSALNVVLTSSRSSPASSAKVTPAPGVPRTASPARPRSTTRSAGSTSSRSAARCLASSTSSPAAWCTAAPPCCRLREPIVPPPSGTRSVSPCTHGDLLDRDAELVAGDHRPGGRVALPVRGGAGQHGGGAVGVHLDAGVLLGAGRSSSAPVIST